MLAAVALAAAVHLGWMDRTLAAFRSFRWLKTVAALVGVVVATFLVGSWALRGPGVTWQPYSDQLLTTARQAQKPVTVDFYATWCSPCRELDEITFHNPDVVKLADLDFVMVKVDLTQKGNPLHTPAYSASTRSRACPPWSSLTATGTSAKTYRPRAGRLPAAGADALPHGDIR